MENSFVQYIFHQLNGDIYISKIQVLIGRDKLNINRDGYQHNVMDTNTTEELHPMWWC